jgi:integrase
VFKGGDGRWQAFIELSSGPDGKRRRKKFRGRTKADVLDAMKRARAEIEAGLKVDPSLTIGALMDDYLVRGLPGTAKSEKTKRGYEWSAGHIRAGIGGRIVRDLEYDDVDKWLRAQAAKGYSKASLTQQRVVLVRALNWAIKRKLIGTNVAALTDVPDAPRRKGTALTSVQTKTLLDAAEGHRFEALFLLALSIPSRPGEQLGVCWDDLDLKQGVWHVRRALHQEIVDGHVRLALGELKSTAPLSRRSVKLPGYVVTALKGRRTVQKRERLLAGSEWEGVGDEFGGLVFATEIGTAVDHANARRTLRQVIAKARKATPKAGLPETLRMYDTRHTSVSLLSEAGVPLEQIADAAGHQVATTAKIYRHVLTPVIKSAAIAMESVLGKATK